MKLIMWNLRMILSILPGDFHNEDLRTVLMKLSGEVLLPTLLILRGQ